MADGHGIHDNPEEAKRFNTGLSNARTGMRGRLKMADQIVRCPYCVLGDDFRPMLPRSGGWFVCLNCIHIAAPEKPEFNCFCQKCGELNRAA